MLQKSRTALSTHIRRMTIGLPESVPQSVAFDKPRRARGVAVVFAEGVTGRVAIEDRLGSVH
jgi:hypothetical protein